MSAQHPAAYRARRLLLRVLSCLGAALLLAACSGLPAKDAAPGGAGSGDHQDMGASLAHFRSVVAANRWAEEWTLYSPSFKRRLDARAGRHVSFEAYRRARGTVASNAQGELAALVRGRDAGERLLGPSAGVATWQAGDVTLTARLVRLTRWVFREAGTNTSVTGYVVDPAEAPQAAKDGSLTLTVPVGARGDLAARTFRRDQVGSYRVQRVWLVDDLGGLGDRIASASGPPPRSSPAGSPGPAAGNGWGSPDG